MNSTMTKILAIILGIISTFFKAYGLILFSVAFILLFDFLTGLIKAKVIGEPITSKKGSVGFWKKVAKILAVAMGIFIDCTMPLLIKAGVNYKLNFPLPFGLIIGVYIIIVELISIAENLDACGVRIPKFVINLLKGAEQQIDNKNV